MQSYKDMGYLPEAVLNGIALLGWNPPHREDPNVLSQQLSVVMRHEVMDLDDMVHQFNLDKISKSGAKFDMAKLQFFNQMHIRERFDYVDGNQQEARQALKKWRNMLLDEMPLRLHPSIKRMSDGKMLKVMDMMKIRMRFLSNIKNHAYFFELPEYDTKLGKNFVTKLRQPALTNKQILADLHDSMEKIGEEQFNAENLNKACSMYLYE